MWRAKKLLLPFNRLGGVNAVTPDPAIATLAAKVQNFWTLDEASGTRADSVGSQTLTLTGAPGSSAAVNGNGAVFSTGNYMAAANNAALQTGNIDFTIACRIFAPTIGANITIAAKGNNSSLATMEWGLILLASGVLDFDIWQASAAQSLNASNMGVIQASKWYDVIAWVDKTAGTMNIEVNGVLNSVAKTKTPAASTGNFTVGAYQSGAQVFTSGIIDDLTFSKSVWTAAERKAWRRKTYPFNVGRSIFDTGQLYTDWGAAISGTTGNVLIPTKVGMSGTVVLYTHGAGETYDAWLTDPLKAGIRDQLLTDGHILCASAAHGDNWGNAAAITDYVNLYNNVTGRFTITRVVGLFQSMGGAAGLYMIQNASIPFRCAYHIYPVCSLTAEFNNNNGTPGYPGAAASIRAAYGIASDGSNFASLTAGHDPVRDFSGANFTIPVRFTSSPSDTVVPKVSNTDAWRTIITPYATTENSLMVTSGEHGDASNFMPSDVKAFFDRYP